MGPAKKAPKIAEHGAKGTYTRLLALGGTVAVMGAVLVLAGATAGGVAAMMFGGSFVALGLNGRRRGPAAQAINTSLNLLALGRLAEAERILDRAEKLHPGNMRAGILQQRSIIALRRGDLPAALAHVDEAVRVPVGFYHRGTGSLQRTNALGIRALVRAAIGDAAGAREDAAAVRASPDALLPSLGRAALAEAMLLERAGDRAALRALLSTHRDALIGGTSPRERAIVRAYQRMVKVAATSPYRQGAPREEAAPADEPALADWVAKIAPGAAAFVRAPALGRGGGPGDADPGPRPAPTAEAKRAIAEARRNAVPGARARNVRDAALRVAAVFALAGAVFAGLHALGSTAATPRGGGAGGSFDAWAFDEASLVLVSIVVAGFGILGGIFVEAHRQGRRLIRAVAAPPARRAEAEAELTALTRSRYALVRAQARLNLASAADQQGDVSALLEHCERGLADATSRSVKGVAAEIITPALAAERAFGLAARDRYDEAAAEIAALPPAFPLLAHAQFRVHLLALVRKGDLAAARAFVDREIHDLPLGPRDELLADAVRVASAPEACGAAEVLRVKEELRIPPLRRWVEAFAPGLLHAVEHGAAEGAEGDEAAEAEAAREEAALEEAARAEAEAAGRGLARA